MSETIGSVSSEDQLQEELEEHFEAHGWTAIREVSPHASNLKADLIVEHDSHGWFGIETKYFDGDGGGKVADAHHQIVSKYRGKRYIGNKINLWAICPYFSGFDKDEWHAQRADWRNDFVRELFCRHGIGYVNPLRSPLLIDFAYSTASYKVPVDTDRHTRHHENVDITEIKSSVEEKIERFGY